MMNSDEDVRGSNIQEIRFVTYLSPSIPRALYEALADHLQRTLGRERISLRVETRVSGPQRGGECSSFADEADVAFMCAPSFVWLRELRPPPVELLGVSPVFNDASSLSGYYSLFNKLAASGADESFFDSISCSGSHLNSIESVLRGEADAAAIDSNVLRIRLREVPQLRESLRVIESWGPFPIQPLVVSSALHEELKERLRAAFLATEYDQRTRHILKRFGLSRFVALGQEDYSLDAHKDLAALLAARQP